MFTYLFDTWSELVWPSGKALGSHFSSKVVVCVPHNYETLKWLSSQPTFMHKSFWWWQCSDRYIISIPPATSIPPFSPSLINLMVSVDVKHHIYLLAWHLDRVQARSRRGRWWPTSLPRRDQEQDFFRFSCFPTAELRTLSLWFCSAQQLGQQLRSTLIAAQCRADTTLKGLERQLWGIKSLQIVSKHIGLY